jgi:multiple sugar transport system substrate-binding protein
MRRSTLRTNTIAAFAVGALALSGCAGSGGGSADAGACEPAAEGEEVTLAMSSWIPNFQQTVDLWNSENPDIQVEYTEVTQGNQGTYQAYLNQIKAGKTADIGYFDYDVMPTFRIQDGLLDLAACEGITDLQDQFIASVWNATALGEEESVFGLGLDFTPESLFYRVDLFEQASIAVPTTWDEYYEAAKAVRATGGYIANLPAWGTFWPTNWMQAGENWFALDNGEWQVDIARGEDDEIVQFLQRLVDEDLVTTYPLFQDEYSKALNAGEIWSQLGGPWGFALIPVTAADTAGNWRIAKMPTWDGSESIASWGGAALGVFKGSAHPYEAAQFLAWATTAPEALALNSDLGGLYPPIKGVVDAIPTMQEPNPFFGDQQVFVELDSWAGEVTPDWIWGPTMVQVNADLESEMAKALSGEQTIAEALKAVQDNTVDAIKAQGLTVAEAE